MRASSLAVRDLSVAALATAGLRNPERLTASGRAFGGGPFLRGPFAGCILHLMEDTCTPAGVAWLYPFSRRRLAGSVRTWGNLEVRPEIFAVALALTTAAVLIAPVATSATLEELRLLTPGAAILLWLFFMLACRVQPQQNR